jgi:hypothetical protein
MGDVDIVCGHLAYLTAIWYRYFVSIWYILWLFGLMLPFWYVVSRNIWQPCTLQTPVSVWFACYVATCRTLNFFRLEFCFTFVRRRTKTFAQLPQKKSTRENTKKNWSIFLVCAFLAAIFFSSLSPTT